MEEHRILDPEVQVRSLAAEPKKTIATVRGALESILAGTRATFVIGSGDLATQVRSPLASENGADD